MRREEIERTKKGKTGITEKKRKKRDPRMKDSEKQSDNVKRPQ